MPTQTLPQQHNDKCRVPTYLSAAAVNTDGQKLAGLQNNNSRSPSFRVTASLPLHPAETSNRLRRTSLHRVGLLTPAAACSDFSETFSVFGGEQWTEDRPEWGSTPSEECLGKMPSTLITCVTWTGGVASVSTREFSTDACCAFNSDIVFDKCFKKTGHINYMFYIR